MRVHSSGDDIVAGNFALTSRHFEWHDAAKGIGVNRACDARIRTGHARHPGHARDTDSTAVFHTCNTSDAIGACNSDTGPGDTGSGSTA